MLGVTRRAVARAPALIQALTNAYASASTPSPVLILGEPGCGKTTFARMIYRHSRYTTTGVLEITPADNVALRLGVPHVPPTVMLENVEQFTAEQQHALAAFFKQ